MTLDKKGKPVLISFSDTKMFANYLEKRADQLLEDIRNSQITAPPSRKFKGFFRWVFDGLLGRGWDITK